MSLFKKQELSLRIVPAPTVAVLAVSAALFLIPVPAEFDTPMRTASRILLFLTVFLPGVLGKD